MFEPSIQSAAGRYLHRWGKFRHLELSPRAKACGSSRIAVQTTQVLPRAKEQYSALKASCRESRLSRNGAFARFYSRPRVIPILRGRAICKNMHHFVCRSYDLAISTPKVVDSSTIGSSSPVMVLDGSIVDLLTGAGGIMYTKVDRSTLNTTVLNMTTLDATAQDYSGAYKSLV